MKLGNIFRHTVTAIVMLGTMSGTVFADTKAVINDDYVNVRKGPSIDYDVLTQLNKGQELTVKKLDTDFFEVSYGEVNSAYVYGEFLDILSAEAVVNDNKVNLRNSPSTSAGIITKLDKGEKINVTARKGEWYTVRYNNGDAYIHADFIDGDLLKHVKSFDEGVTTVVMTGQTTSAPEVTYAVVNSKDGLKLRPDASTSSKEITVLSYGTVLDVIQKNGDWINVSYGNNKGFVSSEFVDVKVGQKPTGNASKGQEIVNYAKQFIGTPYVYGGTSLTKGVDCSGFTYALFSNFGIKLNRTSRDQYNNGTRVDKANLQPGDLVFFNTGKNSAISHVGMYIGGNQFIHSASPGRKGISIASLGTDYNSRNYVGATRVIK